jgi:hypothetical protein
VVRRACVLTGGNTGKEGVAPPVIRFYKVFYTGHAKPWLQPKWRWCDRCSGLFWQGETLPRGLAPPSTVHGLKRFTGDQFPHEPGRRLLRG